ncbi:MAG: NADH-quinone oxidoreductase subunit K [Spirochaetaceae bacterium]|nr:NADH-quinone oxidoreductase subunit K [Spirochaetaceae bacterium]
MIEQILLIILFLIGFWGIIAKKNIIKKIFALSILNSSVLILYITEGSKIGTNAPIMEEGVKNVVDPVPQALMLTAIVIGVCITALALAIAFRLYRYTHTLDIDKIHRKLHDEPF